MLRQNMFCFNSWFKLHVHSGYMRHHRFLWCRDFDERARRHLRRPRRCSQLFHALCASCTLRAWRAYQRMYLGHASVQRHLNRESKKVGEDVFLTSQTRALSLAECNTRENSRHGAREWMACGFARDTMLCMSDLCIICRCIATVECSLCASVVKFDTLSHDSSE